MEDVLSPFQRVLERSGSLAAVVDDALRIVAANRAFLTRFPRAGDVRCASSALRDELVAEADAIAAVQRLQAGSSWREVLSLKPEWAARLILTPGPEPRPEGRFWLAVIEDDASASLARTYADAMPDPQALIDADFHVVWANQSFQHLLEAMAQASARVGFAESPLASPDVLGALRTAQAGIETSRELRLSPGPGLIGAWRARTFPVQPEEAQPLAGLSLRRAFENQGELERANQCAEDRFSDAFESSPFGMALVGLDGRFLIVNDAFARIVGFGIQALLTRTCHALTAPEDIESAREMDALVLAGNIRKYQSERRLIAADGSQRTVIWSSVLAGERKGRPRYAILQIVDLTDARREREQRQDLERKLRHSQKLQALGVLAGRMAHETNNNLQVILNSVEELTDCLATVNPALGFQEALSTILRAVNRGKEVNEKLLIFARNKELTFRIIDAKGLIEGLAKTLRSLLPKSIRLRFDLGSDDLRVRIDVGQFEQVLLNLAINARDAMAEGGELHFTTRRRSLERANLPDLGHAMLEPGDYVEIAVRDNGHGVPESLRERIFEPFFSTKGVGKGTGLGLAMARGVVEQCGGFMELESQVNFGTCFRILLPLERGAAEPAPDLPEYDLEPTGQGQSILVVDDNEEVLRSAERFLTRAGYLVQVAATGELALRTMFPQGRSPDVLLTDVLMPNMLGTKLASLFANVHPTTRVVYMTGFASSEHFAEGLELKHHGVLKKPFSRRELLHAVQEALSVRELKLLPGEAEA